MRRTVIIPLLLSAACSAAGPNPSAPTPAPKPTADAKPAPTSTREEAPVVKDLPPPLETTDAQLQGAAKSIDRFGFDLYAKVEKDGNLIMSPASVAIALGMTFAGAKADTAAEFSKVLHASDSGLESEAWHASMGGLANRWNALAERERPEYMPELAISVANRLFGDKGTTFHDPFLERSARDYRAPLQQLDFQTAAEPSRELINTWVEEQTRDRIKDLIPPNGVTAATRLVLVNAVYFKAQWMDTFQESATSDQPFFVDGSSKTSVPTMARTGYYSHAAVAADGVTLVQMPYENGPFAMVVAVPDKRDGLAALEAKLDAEHVDGWLAALSSKRVSLQFPKFKIDPPDSLKLAKVLIDLGLTKAFGGDADFTGMADAKEELQISDVFHKGFIEVNEKGTEAAAATAVSMRAGSAMPTDEPIAFNVDRPFVFMIRDTETNAILFMGRVTDPRG